MITFVKAKNENQVVKQASLGLQNRLYVRGWSLKQSLEQCKISPSEFLSCLAFASDVPVGIAIADKINGKVSVYVRNIYRRQKIGTRLVKYLLDEKTDGFVGFYGILGSERFWAATNIEYMEECLYGYA